ncbi:MAG: L-histidine N(alpha)-methyltransferase [Acidimicrobiales bacterium]
MSSANGLDVPGRPGRAQVSVYITERDLEVALRRDAGLGLTATPKVLPPRWLYDEVGSKLFGRITRVGEYYPTRRERSILGRHAADICAISEADTLVELGSGSSEKTEVLLGAMSRLGRLRRFAPFDVDEATMRDAVGRIGMIYPGIDIEGVVGDFEEHLGHLATSGRRLIVFLGGTIGNLEPEARERLLGSVASGMSPGESFLLGTDLVKDRSRLVAAYDDAEGVTAAFNKNVLAVLNRRLGAHFDLGRFDHVALYDEDLQRIEMRLRSRSAQVVAVDALGIDVNFDEGEDLRTEISTKFTVGQVEDELRAAGLELVACYTDPGKDFAVTLARR